MRKVKKNKMKKSKKTRRDLIVKFREFWKNLSYTEQIRLWSIMAAIRGEDNSIQRTKHFTTARIRALFFGKKIFDTFSVAGDFSFNINSLSDTQKTDIRTSNSHFNRHVCSAIKALKPSVKKSKIKDLLEIKDFIEMESGRPT